MTARWLPVLLLGSLTAGSWWLLQQLSEENVPIEGDARHVPDYYLEDFSSTTMDELGKPRRRLHASYMAHYEDTGTHELTEPYLVMYRAEGEPWHVRSERGWVSATGEVIILLGSVHIWRENGQKGRRLEVKTRDLRVVPDSDYGETDKPVLIRTPTTESRGVGLRAYLDQSRLELLSQVHTVYANPNP